MSDENREPLKNPAQSRTPGGKPHIRIETLGKRDGRGEQRFEWETAIAVRKLIGWARLHHGHRGSDRLRIPCLMQVQ